MSKATAEWHAKAFGGNKYRADRKNKREKVPADPGLHRRQGNAKHHSVNPSVYFGHLKGAARDLLAISHIKHIRVNTCGEQNLGSPHSVYLSLFSIANVLRFARTRILTVLAAPPERIRWIGDMAVESAAQHRLPPPSVSADNRYTD